MWLDQQSANGEVWTDLQHPLGSRVPASLPCLLWVLLLNGRLLEEAGLGTPVARVNEPGQTMEPTIQSLHIAPPLNLK